MDAKTLREQALAETERFFLTKFGTVPPDDSDEWEEEYRRQFNRLKNGAAPSAPAGSTKSVVEEMPVDLPALIGTPADVRWAFALRADRLKQVPDRDLRVWLQRYWTKSKAWIDSRELPIDVFLCRVEPAYADARRRAASQAATAAASRQAQDAAAAAHQATLKKAGITAAGLLDLIDVSPRAHALPIKEKLAEIHHERRAVRVFETTNPGVLMVLEKRDNERSEYGIERDDGLVADLKIFAQREGS
jgi:hypothetical protein